MGREAVMGVGSVVCVSARKPLGQFYTNESG